ncbi:hypothetical protein M0812_15564 [Anaeramoeba flamelloides]|uniref:Uncharacterized protein n=1 Tax=Anaeramoeba flamelloides TaxID=1746091 RepID=A0AAV7ZGJ5_9EUKA|nr:hypothetical protein M0812_15564 [Anaeramoeba flamelloides]|eukprot:Anaeramoba_flamelloidesa836525_27.p1 GENE.a836525_27~~a836525_27.p1  ORF type:complete len:198 (-),score=10.59 a836525_27:98-691(-)
MSEVNEADQVSKMVDNNQDVDQTTPLTNKQPYKTNYLKRDLDVGSTKFVVWSLFCRLLFAAAICCAWVLPNLIIGNRNKDKGCSNKLWLWVRIFSYTMIAQTAGQLITDFFKSAPRIWRKLALLRLILALSGIFTLVWIIIGMVWAAKEKGCGTMYTIVLVDCIIIFSLIGLSICLGCCVGCCIFFGYAKRDKYSTL